ncbi:DUF7546 family protein [Haloarchaeobius sp. HRN-SO-5]|uniref:DUF7546 family protein n=1 Tax=Haloarchaeobius sp. HRN-SO-5 TaxID=3446118 RepID=UPI003EBB8E47
MATERVDPVELVPEPSTVFAAFIVVTGEALVAALYAAEVGGVSLSMLVLPFVWIDVGLWALWRASPPPAPTRRRRLAALVTVGYGLVLAYFGGVLDLGYAFYSVPGYDPSYGWYVTTSLPPGLGPAVVYESELLVLRLFPYQVVGYAALVYLVYATVIDATGAAVSGVLGLLSCISCSWPILAAVASGVAGGSSALASAAYQESFPLSTAVFVVTVGLLYWRPLR